MARHRPTDPKARLDEALRTQRKVHKHQLRPIDEDSSVIRTFVAWVRGDPKYDTGVEEDSSQQEQPPQVPVKRTMGVLVLITIMLALIVAMLVIVAVKVARQN